MVLGESRQSKGLSLAAGLVRLTRSGEVTAMGFRAAYARFEILSVAYNVVAD
jgi:hypothetical protein